jgi:hypothetical protein
MSMKSPITVPILIITVGVGWLLTVLNVLPGVNWVWLLALGAVGSLVLLLGGLNKLTIVVGPFLILATLFSLLRQTGRISMDIEVPLLVISAGVLMLVARQAPIPPPRWMSEPPKG